MTLRRKRGRLNKAARLRGTWNDPKDGVVCRSHVFYRMPNVGSVDRRDGSRAPTEATARQTSAAIGRLMFGRRVIRGAQPAAPRRGPCAARPGRSHGFGRGDPPSGPTAAAGHSHGVGGRRAIRRRLSDQPSQLRPTTLSGCVEARPREPLTTESLEFALLLWENPSRSNPAQHGNAYAS